MDLSINVIVAYSDNYVIGCDNEIPWLYKEDLKYFQDITTLTDNNFKKNIVIMGKNTYNSLHMKKLKNRVNIVITNKTFDNELDLYFVDSLCSAIEICKNMQLDNMIEKIFIIGGESIYAYFFKSYYYKYLDKIYITRIHKKFEGNKFFYGLEEKFYYVSVEQSSLYPEIEYRVLQYVPKFYNIEKKYLDFMKYMLHDNYTIYDKELNSNIMILYDKEINLEINLKHCFPLFSFIKDDKDNVLKNVMSIFDNIYFTENMNNLINSELNIKYFDSIYSFNIENNNLNCNVQHSKGNILTDIIYNILFSSLMVTFIAKIIKIDPYMIKYNCKNSYFIEHDLCNIDAIAWNVPDVLPLLKLRDKDYKNIHDYLIDDLIFLGIY